FVRAVYDQVVGEVPVAARDKPRFPVLLEDAESPPAGSINRVVPHDRPAHPNEGHWRHRADERAILHGDVPGLAALGLGADEGQPRAAAEVDCPLPGMLEPAAEDHHLAAAPLGLNTVIAPRVSVPKGAADDLSPVTSHHVDARAAAAPSFEGAVLDPEIV